jgi:hypothetical protein
VKGGLLPAARDQPRRQSIEGRGDGITDAQALGRSRRATLGQILEPAPQGLALLAKGGTGSVEDEERNGDAQDLERGSKGHVAGELANAESEGASSQCGSH